MMLDTRALCALMLGLALVGCRDRVELARVPWAEASGDASQRFVPTAIPHGGGGAGCQDDLLGACAGSDTPACRDASACVAGNTASIDGYCGVASGADICDAGDISLGYIEYCRIEACFGASFQACLDAGRSECQPPTNTCERIRALAGACPGFAYDCASHPEEQSACFLEVLEALDDACVLFDEIDLLCVQQNVSIEGAASCMLQECFELTTYNACYGNLEILCDWIP